MPARGTPTALALGPGYLYIGSMGRAEPADLTTAWAAVDAGWVLLGYTDTGSEFDYNLATATVDVAEELDPISNQTTGRTSTVKFAAAQMTITNLKLAMNGGVVTVGTGIQTFEPPDLGTEVRTMIGFESEDHTERWVWRQCFQTGTLAITRQKGAAKATLPMEFTLEKPATGSRLYKAILSTPLRA
jgi:hypothetical protein